MNPNFSTGMQRKDWEFFVFHVKLAPMWELYASILVFSSEWEDIWRNLEEVEVAAWQKTTIS